MIMIFLFFPFHPNFYFSLHARTCSNPNLPNIVTRSSEIAYSPNTLEFLTLE